MIPHQNSDTFLEGDVLVVGAGPAGCCAALKAKENGLHVILLDKADAEWSGSVGRGVDLLHLTSRNLTGLEAIENIQHTFESFYTERLNPNVIYRLWEKEPWAFEELERYVSLKWHDGDYLWHQRGMHGGQHLRVAGLKMKPMLAAAVRQAKVNLLNRTMLVDLLTNKDSVVGATAVNTRSGEFIVIKAKAVVVATGAFGRHFEPTLPQSKYKFRYHHCPSALSGDGVAAAYRAGAELINMELTEGAVPHTDYCSITKGCLMQVVPLKMKQYTWDGEELIGRLTKEKFRELEQQGKTPVYRSLEHLPDRLHKRLEVNYIDEGFVNLKLAEDRGFNPRTHRYDVSADKPYPVSPEGTDMTSLNTDEDFMTSVKGLYAIGDTASCTGGVMAACTSGFYVGDIAGKFISEAGEPVVDGAQLENLKRAALAPLGFKGGQEPIELECAIRHICERYVGILKSGGKLNEGIRRLGSLRRVFLPKLMAENPHYLMRCLEVRNIMDLAEVHMQACLSRKETRGFFIRLDYPRRDPARDGKLTHQRLENGKAVIELKEVPKLSRNLLRKERR